MSKRLISTIAIVGLFSLWIIACQKGENDTKISSHNKNDSHNLGTNCMNCHYQAGPGEGWFSAAGSVYGNYQNHSVRIIDAINGALLKTVEIDKLGNLYTTESINMSNGITIDVIDNTGQVVSVMSTVVYTAQCNLCHDGKFQPKIVL